MKTETNKARVIPGLSDAEMELVLEAAATVPLEKRNLFLLRFIAFLKHGMCSTESAINRALQGLIHAA
jgi:hypothetical protein